MINILFYLLCCAPARLGFLASKQTTGQRDIQNCGNHYGIGLRILNIKKPPPFWDGQIILAVIGFLCSSLVWFIRVLLGGNTCGTANRNYFKVLTPYVTWIYSSPTSILIVQI